MALYTGEFFGYRELLREGGWIVPLPPPWIEEGPGFKTGLSGRSLIDAEILSPPPYKYQVFSGTATDDYSDIVETDFPCRLIDIQVFSGTLEIQFIYNIEYWDRILETVTMYDNPQEIVDRFWNEVVGDTWRISDRLLRTQTIRAYRLKNGDPGVDSRYQIIIFE